MDQVLFIVWRESVEAMLVIGILYAWLRGNPNAGQGMRYLWGGVAAGLGFAFLLGGTILLFDEMLPEGAQDYFQLAMVLVASALIVQMVLWMKRHGRHLKRTLEQGMQQNVDNTNWWGMLLLVALAVGREGSETVIFLYSSGVAQQGMALLHFWLAAATGFVLALVTFWLLQLGGKVFSWRLFFRVTESLLLLLGASMLVTGVEKMIGLEWLPALVDPLWDSSALVPDDGRLGGLLSGLTGYRAQPSLMLLLCYAAYWAAVWFLLRRAQRAAAAPAVAAVAQGQRA
ncbi:FTR1 family protein [Leeia sp.]|uniref:FTR1 family iron permease n=1 Tax=Leeia sp. TaxID=2884678 RepID=UPI0035AE63A5